MLQTVQRGEKTLRDKLLVLGAGTFQMPLIAGARKMGIEVITITPDGDYPGIAAADKVYYHDARDQEFALEVGRKEKINGIISDQAEIFVRPSAYVAENLGLPGNTYETACIYTDKALMRKRGRELGLATIESFEVRDLEEALKDLDYFGGSAIIKPVDNCSSRGISRINGRDDLIRAWDEAVSYSGTGEVIIEKFIDGPQFEVDSIALNGEVRPMMYADLKEFSIRDVFSSAARLYPSVADEEVIHRLLDYSNRINEGFGMHMGVSHNEYIMDSKTGEIYLIEGALRGGGTYIGSHIAKLETGLDTAEFLINAALGRIDRIPEFTMNRCHAGYAAFYLPEGEVISTDGTEEVAALSYVDKTKFNDLSVGQHTRSIKDKDQRCAVVLSAESREQLLQRIEEIKSMLQIKVKTEDGIRGPIWE